MLTDQSINALKLMKKTNRISKPQAPQPRPIFAPVVLAGTAAQTSLIALLS
jgi:hypothetical protein